MAEQKDDIAYYFDLAIQQYSEINLFFYLERCEYSNFKSLCVGLKNGHFITRVSLEKVEHTPIVWGTEISGYFTIRDTEIVPCHFKSRLVRIYNAPPDSLFLVFPLPDYMDHNQMRFSKRISLDPEIAQEFGLWHGMMGYGDESTLPILRWISLTGQQCQLAEISANGLRIDFEEKSPFLEKMGINDEILLRGNFGLPTKPFEMYIVGNIVRIMKKPESDGIMSVGCHFQSWQKIDNAKTKAWFRADPQEGIGQVAQWLSRNYRRLGK